MNFKFMLLRPYWNEGQMLTLSSFLSDCTPVTCAIFKVISFKDKYASENLKSRINPCSNFYPPLQKWSSSSLQSFLLFSALDVARQISAHSCRYKSSEKILNIQKTFPICISNRKTMREFGRSIKTLNFPTRKFSFCFIAKGSNTRFNEKKFPLKSIRNNKWNSFDFFLSKKVCKNYWLIIKNFLLYHNGKYIKSEKI